MLSRNDKTDLRKRAREIVRAATEISNNSRLPDHAIRANFETISTQIALVTPVLSNEGSGGVLPMVVAPLVVKATPPVYSCAGKWEMALNTAAICAVALAGFWGREDFPWVTVAVGVHFLSALADTGQYFTKPAPFCLRHLRRAFVPGWPTNEPAEASHSPRESPSGSDIAEAIA